MAEPIILIEPDEGRQWSIGSTYNIEWTSDGSCGTNLLIHLFKGDMWLQTIGWTASSSSYSWTIPLTLASGNDYSIRINDDGSQDENCGNDETWNRHFEIISEVGVVCTVPACNLVVT